MATLNLLFRRTIPINTKIEVYVPSVGEILACEDDYNSLVSAFTAMPIDRMVELDKAGIDFTKINEYDLFLIMFEGLKRRDTRMVLGDLDLSKFEYGTSEQNGLPVLIDTEHDICIDREIHAQIANALRKLHHLEKNTRKPANDEAKQFMLERAKRKARRRRNRVEESDLESLIVAMVNTEQFKYGYEGTLELSIYQFNESVRQIIKKVEFDNRMIGIYSGTVSAKDLSPDELNWLKHK